ncbi:hypothetical protein [Solibacillus isronensis]|uniref:hypothetical protein n=1 Tax=Solibacillus isronensis TaxID=412383 RepID=UPI0009A78DFC|nr:hypothetical protein [Solibacillus isronensis]
MTNSQVKQAIDETIGRQPLMEEAFVQKVMQKKQRKKPLPFLQPAIVVLLMLAVGVVLYFTPNQTLQAVEIESSYLEENHQQLVADFYEAIIQEDKKALAKLSSVDSEQAYARYSIIEFNKPVEVIKTIDTEKSITLFLKLQANDIEYLDKLVINKESEMIKLDITQSMVLYTENIELPKEFLLEYKEAPYAPVLENLELDINGAEIQPVNDHILYQIPTDEGNWRVFETPEGKRLDLNVASDQPTVVITGTSDQFFILDTEANDTTYIYRNKAGDYQIVTGQIRYQGVTTYATDFHEEPILIFGGEEPKVITIEEGQLMYANIFEQANLVHPSEFYHTEDIGPYLLVEYSDDLKQLSTYYSFTEKRIYTDQRKIGLLEARPEHFNDMSIAHRYNDQLIYIFNDNTIHYRGKSLSGELIEETYTNIQIETKDNQYFITGDNGFSWTLTRTAPRILKDEKGIEYTVPVNLDDYTE